jgi:sphingosine kinase
VGASKQLSESLLNSIPLVIQLKPCPVQLSIKVAERDKKKMVQDFQTRRNESEEIIPTLSSPSLVGDVESGELPPLRYLPDDTDGWITVDEPILYLYAGKGPYVGR